MEIEASPTDVDAEVIAEVPDDPEAELDLQATVMAEKALEKLPASVRALKLPKVKEGIMKRLREQAQKQAGAAPVQATPAAGAAAAVVDLSTEVVEPQPPPPPPPPDPSTRRLEDLQGIVALGDEPWYADIVVRRALRDSVKAGHAEQKILVGPPLEEIRRICPDGDRMIAAGGVLRLGGSLLGGYGEADIAYAYRQLSRALHPDKNKDVPEAPLAFKRLTEAVDELKSGLTEARNTLEVLCGTMGRAAAPELMERPQEALFAEATRMLAAVLAFSGEGVVPNVRHTANQRAFVDSDRFAKCNGAALINDWYNSESLISYFGQPAIRTAYDCSPKRFRAQFLCLLNRALIAEGKRQNDCVRGIWQSIMTQYPELGLWRQLLDKIKERVWTLDPEAQQQAINLDDDSYSDDEDDEDDVPAAKKRKVDLPPWPDRKK